MGETFNFKRLLNRYRSQSRARGIKWNLSSEEFRKMTKKPCYLCASQPHQLCKDENRESFKKYDGYLYSGVDRVDSSVGYEFSNCRPCCGNCNRMKNNMTLRNFKRHIKKIMKEIL